MGNTESTSSIDVNTKVSNAVLAKIKQVGSQYNVNMTNEITDSTFVIDGSKCPNGVTEVTLGNNFTLDDSIVFSAVAEATASVMQEITNQLNAQNTPIAIGNITTSVSNTNEIATEIATEIASKCSTVDINQKNSLDNVLASVSCAKFNITNDAEAKLACAVDTAAKTTADITQKVKTDASTSNSLLNMGTSTYIIIAVVIVVIIVMFVIMSGSSGTIIIVLIVIVIIAGIAGVIALNSTNTSEN